MPNNGAAAVPHFDVLIVGAGHAGAQLAALLRQRKFAGSIAIVGDEADPPYERPPLSKAYLSGEKSFDRILIRPASFWVERDIDLLLGRRVGRVDADAHQVECDDGSRIGYGALVWAAGGGARRLTCEGHDLRGVHTVRTRADADPLMAELPDCRTVAVVGGGYIGLEAAAAMAKAGKRVALFETLDRVLARVAGVALSRFYEAEHRRHGVTIRLDTAISAIEGRDGKVTGVRATDGTVTPADIVIVGIGIEPAVAPLAAAGAATGNGVHVDAICATSLPDIYAIGDCALHANAFADGASIRLESVQNANDMAATVAGVLTGQPVPYQAVPWFWSDQYDLRLQTVGLSGGHDMAIVRGDPDTRSFSVVYLKGGAVIALDCVNAARDFVQGRSLVAGRAIVPPAALANPKLALKDVRALATQRGEAA